MSANIVGMKTIDLIVRGLNESRTGIYPYTGKSDMWTCDIISSQSRDALGQALVNQNYASVNYRYDEHTPAPVYTFSGNCEPINLKDLYGCIRYYIYQSCETPGWTDCGIYHALLQLKDWCAEQMIKKLYGESSPWGID